MINCDLSSCLAVGKSLYSGLVSTAGDISGIFNPINPSFPELPDICIRSEDHFKNKYLDSPVMTGKIYDYDENVGSRTFRMRILRLELN